MENYYNDENLFTATKENIQEKIRGYVLIPIYYGIDDDGEFTIDSDSMKDEFERTVYGIETVTQEINEE
jgi:hypothetical protein